MGHVPAPGMQRDGKVALALNLDESVRSNRIHGRALPAKAIEALDVTRFKQAMNPPVECASAGAVGIVLQNLEELAVTDEARIADLAKQRECLSPA
jgi:hypothetical protein